MALNAHEICLTHAAFSKGCLQPSSKMLVAGGDHEACCVGIETMRGFEFLRPIHNIKRMLQGVAGEAPAHMHR